MDQPSGTGDSAVHAATATAPTSRAPSIHDPVDSVHDPKSRSPTAEPDEVTKEAPTPKGPRFWLTFVCLILTAFVSALEGSIVSTALPSIARALDASENYIWVVNVYYLTRYVSLNRNRSSSAIFYFYFFPLVAAGHPI